MKLLVTNDDGIDAPGLQALIDAASSVGEATTVAPMSAHSGCSHRITMDRAMRVDRRGDRRFAVDGTPADCVRVGLHDLVSDVECVLSGINAGGNLGADVHYSGTVAAAREAALHGRVGIAFSHYSAPGRDFDWPRASLWVAGLLAKLLARSNDELGVFWNVNLPHPPDAASDPEIVFCDVDPHPYPLTYSIDDDHFRHCGAYQRRPRHAGADVDVCFGGAIAVSKLSLRNGA